jgi:hypothetical protein
MRWLKTILIRLFSRKLTQLFLEGPPTPGDRGSFGPYDRTSLVREPRWRGPSGLTMAAAVPEPDEDNDVLAVGSRLT